MDDQQRLEELTLLMLVLQGWRENVGDPGKMIFKSWAGFLWEILSNLESKGLIRRIIRQEGASTCIVVNNKGLEMAEKLKLKYLELK